MQRRSPFLCATPRRTCVEALITCAISWPLLLLLLYHAPYYSRFSTSLGSGMTALFIVAIRLRTAQDQGYRWLIREGLFFGLCGIVLGIVTQIIAILAFAHMPASPFSNRSDIFFSIIAAICLNIATGIITRILVLLLTFWNRLRRRQLFWTITHAQVMVVAFGAGLLIIIFELIFIFNTSSRPRLILIIPTTIGLIVLSLFGLIAIIPPFAVFSYFVVRLSLIHI